MGDITVVGTCATAAEGLAVLRDLKPSVVLLDFDLGTGRAFDFLDGAAGCEVRILILTAGVGEAEAVRLVKAGVAGILHKQNTPDMLRKTIHEVAAGGVCIENHYLKPLFPASMSPGLRRGSSPGRDKAILRDGVCKGWRIRRLAASWTFRGGAVKSALRHLFQKLGVRTRAQLVKVALEEYRDQL